jgi:hypothetical protein
VHGSGARAWLGAIRGLLAKEPAAGQSVGPVSLRALVREKELWLLVGAGVALFFRPLFLGQTFFFRDLYLHFYPKKLYLASLLLSGQLPLWDTLLHGGQPFFSNPINHVLYPTNLLYLVLDPVTAFNVEIAGHFILAGVGAYVLARAIGLHRASSLVAGAIFAFSGYTLSLGNHLTRLFAMAGLPWILAFWHLFWKERRQRWFLMAVVAQVIQLLSGGPELVVLTVLLLGCWAVAVQRSGLGVGRRLLAWIGLEVLAVAIAAVQLVPAAELVARSGRVDAPFSTFSTWSVRPARLPELAVPGILGRTDTLAMEDYWGTNLEEGRLPYILSLYLGLCTLVLAFAALATRTGGLPRRVRLLATVLLAGTGALSLGSYLPGLDAVFPYLPWVSIFRYPVKFLAMWVPIVALLAGVAVESLFYGAHDRSRLRRMATALGGAAAVLLGAAATLATSPGLATRVESSLFAREGPAVTRALVWGCAHASVFGLLACLIFAVARRGARAWHPYLLAAVVAADLLLAGRTLNPVTPRAFFTSVPRVAALLHDQGGRLFRARAPARVMLRSPSNDIASFYRWNRTVLDSYVGFSYGIPMIFHEDFDGLAPRPTVELTSRFLELPWERRLPILSAAGVSWVLTHERLALKGLEPAAAIPNASTLDINLYRNRTAGELVAFVPSARFVNTRGEALDAVAELGFDPRREAVLLAPRVPLPACPSHGSSVQVVERSANACRVMVRSSCGGYVVFSESFDPGWRTTVDGVSAEQVPANVAFAAVRVPSGEHLVQWRYVPAGVVPGGICSFLGVLALAGAWRFRLAERLLGSATESGR